MKKHVLFVFILFSQVIFGQKFIQYHNFQVENTSQYVEGNSLQKDYLLFLKLLENTHPLFCNTSWNVDSLKQAGYEYLKNPISPEDFHDYLQEIMALLHDGHSTLMPNMNHSKIYPINFFIDKSDVYIRGIDQKYKKYLGHRISAINGAPVQLVLNSFTQKISSDNKVAYIKNIQNLFPLLSMWNNSSYFRSDSLLELTLEDESIVQLKACTKNNLKLSIQKPQKMQNNIRIRTKQPFAYKLLLDKKICYFQFTSCMDRSTIAQQYAGQLSPQKLQAVLSQYPLFDEFLTTMFKDISDNNISTLVIDVRNNKGGNSILCDKLLAYLKAKEEIKTFSSEIRLSWLWSKYYPELSKNYYKQLTDKNIETSSSQLYNTQIFENQLVKEENVAFDNVDQTIPIFKGKIYFIQNKRTYSSAGLLLTNARDNGIGLIIGSESSYKPCHYGDLLGWELPNSHIKGYISHKYFYRPNNSLCKEQVLIPDVLINGSWTDYMNGNDPCWAYILNH